MHAKNRLTVVAGLMLAGGFMAMALPARAVDTFGSDEKYRPRLFARFGGEFVNVPDGMTQDADGNLYLSVPNFINNLYPGCIMKRAVGTGEWSVFVTGLINPDTNRGCPMGMEMGPDGNLYYCDNQYFNSKDYKSRILKVVICPCTGKPVKTVPVVENIKLANAIRFYGGDLFFTDTYFDLDRPDGVGIGGVYRVPMKDFANGPVKLLPKPDYKKDKYFVGNSETKPLPGRGGDNSGCDGLCIDRDGNLFFGTFGSGRFYTMARKADGSYGKPELLIEDPARFACCDGITYDRCRHCVYMTDSALNAVHKWDIATKTFSTLWRNGDTDGADGLLDQPCEPIVWHGKLVVVNFDMAFPGLTNTENDKVHTLSVIDL